MKTLRLLVVTAVLFVSGNIKAGGSLSVSATVLDSLPSHTFHLGDTADLLITVFNTGNTIFEDSLIIEYSINGVLYSLPNDTSGITYTLDTLSIYPQNSISKLLHFTFTGPSFYVGPTVVVIWPRSPSAITVDSSSTTLIILPASGIQNIDKGNLKMYLSNGQLWVQSDDPLKSIKIYDTRGRAIVQQEISNPATIPMYPYAAGVYFAEVTLADNSRKVVKIYNVPLIR
ncbi:MAG: hypothetical protein JWO06_1462 [Bacteroidota bacterium]|nr:hypothetical protein [Bacteroidota bacterium]